MCCSIWLWLQIRTGKKLGFYPFSFFFYQFLVLLKKKVFQRVSHQLKNTPNFSRFFILLEKNFKIVKIISDLQIDLQFFLQYNFINTCVHTKYNLKLNIITKSPSKDLNWYGLASIMGLNYAWKKIN